MSNVNFSIAYPEIPWDAVTITASSEESGFPVTNLFYGGSGVIWKRSGTATSSTITFDLGLTKSSTANYCILRGISNTVSQQGSKYGVNIAINASTDNFVSSNVLVASQTPIELVGPKDEDAILIFDQTIAYRYWRVVIATTSSIQHQLRGLFIGNLFNFNGVSPYYPYASGYVETAQPFISDRGTLFKSSVGRKQRLIEINWRNVLDSTRDFFQSRIIEAKDDTPFCFVHKDSIHNPLTVYKQPKALTDFAPVAAYLATPERMFDATSGGALTAVGAAVARWENTISGSHHATQATLGNRPLRGTEPVVGRRNLWNFSEPASATGYAHATNLTFRASTSIPNVQSEVYLLDATLERRLGQNVWPTTQAGKTFTLSFLVRLDSGLLPNTGAGSYRDFTVTWDNSDVTNYALFSYQDLGGGVYRARITRTFATSSLAVNIRKYLGLNNNMGVTISQMQIEEASSMTAYQRTVGAHESYQAGIPNRDYLAFDGTDDWLTAGTGISKFSSYTIYAVIQGLGTGTQSVCMAGDNGNSTNNMHVQLRRVSGDGFVRRLGTQVTNGAGSVTLSDISTPTEWIVPSIAAVTYQTGNDFSFLAFNGTNLPIVKSTFGATSNTGTARPFIMGKAGDFASEFLNGKIYGILVFNVAHSTSDRQYIEHLLSERFSIGSLEAPTNTNVLTAWINEYEITSGENANLNNISLSLIEDII